MTDPHARAQAIVDGARVQLQASEDASDEEFVQGQHTEDAGADALNRTILRAARIVARAIDEVGVFDSGPRIGG